MRTTALLLVGLLLALAGCAGGSGAPTGNEGGPTAPPPKVSGDTGAIAGTVTDDQISPIPNAQVLVNEIQVTVTTDSEGAFTVNEVPPGKYNLFIAALGFDSAVRKAEVVAGEVTKLTVSLVPLATEEPWHHPMKFDGYMQCTWRFGSSGPCFYNYYDASDTVFTKNNRAFLYTVFPHMRTLIGELEFPTTSFATTNTMTLLLSYANRTGGHVFGSIEGASPVTQICSRTADEWEGCNGGSQGLSEKPEVSEEKGLYMRHFVSTGRARVAGQSPVNYGISAEQPITLWVTVFYNAPAPEGYSALPDA